MPMPVQDAIGRRDEARWRTRRLSWLIAGGAASAAVALGAVFSQLLPGHAAASTQQGAGAPAPAGGSGAASGQHSARPRQHRTHSRPAQAQPTQAPAPAPAPPQVVSGGS